MSEPSETRAVLISSTPRAALVWAFTLLAASGAGLGAWAAGERYRNQFVPPERFVMVMGTRTNIPTYEEKTKADRKNASLANAILGASLGLALGLAGGLARGSVARAATAGALGLILGMGVGVGASELTLPVYYRQLDKDAEEMGKDVVFPLMIHAATWSALGAIAGAVLALGTGAKRERIASAAVAGLIGAAIGAVIYEVVGALAFPADRTTEPLAAHWAPRLIAKMAVTLFASILAAFALLSPGRAARKPSK